MKSKYTISEKSESHIFFHSFLSNKTIKAPLEAIKSYEDLKKVTGINEYLERYQFEASDSDDDHWNEYFVEMKEEKLQLIIMPHQNCNFRCAYCYEKFEKNKMSEDVQKSLVKYVERKLQDDSKIKMLLVNWFGGEPLLAKDVIYNLSEEFMRICKDKKVKYVSQITSNGYLLNYETFNNLLKYNVLYYQISLDGDSETHDKHRMLIGGQPTYNKILKNLVESKNSRDNFKITIRMNLGIDNHKAVPNFIATIKENFDNDKRYDIYFQDIRYWGGEHSMNDLPEEVVYSEFQNAVKKGANICNPKSLFARNSSCFAASQNSFIIGVDGLLYKCTIALYDDINKVSTLEKDGSLKLDSAKMNLWVNGGKNDSVCHSCHFSPVCHGDSCPLHRIKKKKQPCPTAKYNTKEIINIIDSKGEIDAELSIK
ncbi:radical SAM protein [Staphylococcus pseudintermedius]